MDVIWLIFLFLLGACVGSFLNVVIYRLPRGESLVFPGSRCPACGRSIRWYDNLPLISWFVLAGKCRFCKAPIRPRYVFIEAVTACLFAGLYVCYFLLDLRRGAGTFDQAWPMYAAHVALLCALLACTAVDLELWIIPVEVMWFAAIAGVAAAAFRPHPFMPLAPPTAVAVAAAALVGLAVGCLLLRWNLLQPSFLDAEPPPAPGGPDDAKDAPQRIRAVAVTAAHGVNPRVEVLREVLFLLPAIVLSVAVAVLLHVRADLAAAWARLFDAEAHPALGPHLACGGAAVFGYVVGGACVWGIRILGTLAFGKEAMGLGDAHIVAGVGAVAGWLVATLAFFVAPFLGLAWAIYLWIRRSQRELPYGPWLALATLLVLLFYDVFMGFLGRYGEALRSIATNGAGT